MLFQTPEFLFLLVTALALYWTLPQARLYILAAASMFFYGWANTAYLGLFLAMSALTYVFSLGVKGKQGRTLLFFGILLNCLNLICFKYAVFLLRELGGLLGVVLLPPGNILAQLVMPIGISFYTFQMIAYLVDVSRGEIAPTSFLRFWVFISFFGQLVAGPIMRGRDFQPQIQKVREIKWDSRLFKIGIYLIMLGLFKKIVLADQIAYWADWCFARPKYVSGVQAWLGAYIFGFQIYFDFSGYCDMALGLGKLFGLKLTWNFRTPYLSRNPSEFWRRWHITLSSWVRDYIYIPLGGSRRGTGRHYLNLLAAMVICGFWHGAAWTFLLWGAYHGLVLALYHRINKKMIWNKLFSVFLTYNAAALGWVLFRAENLKAACIYYLHMFSGIHLIDLWSNKKMMLLVLTLFLLHLGEEYIYQNKAGLVRRWSKVPAFCRGLAYFGAGMLIVGLLPVKGQSFIYFRF